jgi:hypothetical protein
MKKMLSLLLCALLLFSCASALGVDTGTLIVELPGRFRLSGPLPAGYTFSLLSQTDLAVEGVLTSSDPAAPVIDLAVCFNEIYANTAALENLDRPGMEDLKATFTEEYRVEFDTVQTAGGIRAMTVQETGDESDFLAFYTIWQGHEIELVLHDPSFSPSFVVSGDTREFFLNFACGLEITPDGE